MIQLGKTNRKLDAAFEESKSLDRLKSNILFRKMEFFRRSRDALLRENDVITRLIEASYADKGLLKPVIEPKKNFLQIVRVDILACREEGMVKVCITDTGIGIPEEKMGKLFEKMYQADSETTRKFGGIGIGLSIAKCIVEAHGGRIWAESKTGEGSKFCFTIPAQEEA